MKQIFFEPSFSNENEYISNIINGFENNNVEIFNKGVRGKKSKIKCIIRFLLNKNVKIFHINWIENVVVRKKTKNKLLSNLWLIYADICHLFRKNMVWTMHNTVPHGCEDLDFALKFYTKWAKKMNVIIVHCKESKQYLVEKCGVNSSKICVVSHGAYKAEVVSQEKLDFFKEKYNINENTMVFLFFGQIDDYKNIPLLIEAFEELNLSSTKLLICGGLSHRLSEKNKNWILNHKLSKNIILDCRFILEEEISPLFQMSDVVVLPYDKVSMQNSGVAILAISNGTPFIIPSFGFIKDIKEEPFVYTYDYKSNEEHKDRLKEAILNFYNIKKNLDRSELQDIMKTFVDKRLDWNNICGEIIKSYEIGEK